MLTGVVPPWRIRKDKAPVIALKQRAWYSSPHLVFVCSLGQIVSRGLLKSNLQSLVPAQKLTGHWRYPFWNCFRRLLFALYSPKAREALPSKRDRQRQGFDAIGIFLRRRLYLLVVKRRYAALGFKKICLKQRMTLCLFSEGIARTYAEVFGNGMLRFIDRKTGV